MRTLPVTISAAGGTAKAATRLARDEGTPREPSFAGRDSRSSDGTNELHHPLARWPDRSLLARFAIWRSRCAHALEDQSWPEVLGGQVAREPVGGDREAMLNELRARSALISMLVHLQPGRAEDGSLVLVNARRRRTIYGSYPTPPAIGQAIARHVERHLPKADRPMRLLDPTIEGAPILLECAIALAHRACVQIIGIDRSEAAVAASRTLFVAASDRVPLAAPHIVSGDSLAMMEELDPIDALVNNPPWGERSLNGAGQFAGVADPYSHFAAKGLRLLKPGAPFGLVLPAHALNARSARNLRAQMAEDCELDSLTFLPPQCFPRATVRTILLLGRRKGGPVGEKPVEFIHFPQGALTTTSQPPLVSRMARADLMRGGDAWLALEVRTDRPAASKAVVPLGSLCDVSAGAAPYKRGRGKPPQTSRVVRDKPFSSATSRPGDLVVLRGRNVRPFHCDPADEFITPGPHLATMGDHEQHRDRPRVYVRELCSRSGRLVAAPALPGTIPRYGLFALRPLVPLEPMVLAAILNSQAAAHYVAGHCDGMLRESFQRVRVGNLRDFPIPRALIDDADWRATVLAACETWLAAGSEDQRGIVRAEIDRLVDMAYHAEPRSAC